MILRPGDAVPLSHDIADYPDGLILPLDKAWRWTSADLVRKIKFAAIRHFGKKNLKVGHAGTLDPLATGVLLLCIGPATRQAQALQDSDKEYVADLCLGATTPSYDLEKEIDTRFPFAHITAEAVRSVLETFTGEQEQVAPLFSAKSVDGVRAYEIARRLYRNGRSEEIRDSSLLRTARIRIDTCALEGFWGADDPGSPLPAHPAAQPQEDVLGASSRIHVSSLEGLRLPIARIRIACSKGTYIRALARDIGEALGSGAFLLSLQRSRSGAFRVEDALAPEEALSRFSPRSA